MPEPLVRNNVWNMGRDDKNVCVALLLISTIHLESWQGIWEWNKDEKVLDYT